MEFNQKINSVPIKPRKVRLVVRQIKHWPLLPTIERLKLVDKSVANFLVKGLGAACDRIKVVNEDPKDFIIKRINCGESLKMKRRMIESRGRTRKFSHQRSNILIVIGKKDNSREEVSELQAKKSKAEDVNEESNPKSE